MPAQILILAGPDTGQMFNLLPGQTLRIGRSSNSDTRLNDGTVSRIHCEIIHQGTEVFIENKSDKGTWLNGLSITREQIRHGDIVQIGGTQFRFQRLALENSDTLLQPVS